MLNQNQSWNLSLAGVWSSTTVNGITEKRTFNEVYEILTSNSNPLTYDRKGYLTQNKDSSQYTWDHNNQFRLHKGTVSLGCVTVCNDDINSEKWNNIERIIKNTKPEKSKGRKESYRILEVIGKNSNGDHECPTDDPSDKEKNKKTPPSNKNDKGKKKSLTNKGSDKKKKDSNEKKDC